MINSDSDASVRHRLGNYNSIDNIKEIRINYNQTNTRRVSNESFRRIFLLIFAVTVHNIPGNKSTLSLAKFSFMSSFLRGSCCWCWFWCVS